LNGTNGNVKTTKPKVDSAPVHKPTATKKKSFPKKKLSKWPAFIINTLKASGKPMTALNIYPSALKHFNAKGKADQTKTLRNLQGHIRGLAKTGKLKVEMKKGRRDHFFSVA